MPSAPACRSEYWRSGTPGTETIRCCNPSKSICTVTGARGRRGVARLIALRVVSCGVGGSPVRTIAATRSRRWSRRRRADASIFVAFRQQRTGFSFLQHREVQSKVFVVIVRSHVEPLRTQTKIGRSQKPEILSARIPRRPNGVGESISDLFRLAGLDVADEDRVIHRTQTAGVSDPLRIRTPHRIRACACGTIHGSLPTIFACPLATSSTQTFKFVSLKRIFFESGDHEACSSASDSASTISRGGVSPSCASMYESILA